LAEYINTLGWNRPAFYNNGHDDDEDCTITITSDFLITDSLSMGDEHLNTIPEKESDEFNKSSVDNLVPNPKPTMVVEDDEMSKDKEIDKLMDGAYHKEKMLLCKQEEAGFQYNAEQADWRDNTDDEPKDQELEKPTNNNLQTSSNTSTGYDNQRIFNVAGARENVGVYTELDEVTNLQCDYLETLKKCECLEKELSKSKIMSNSFKALQKHAINLELDLQQCQEKIKNYKSFKENQSTEFRKEREQYFEIQDLKAQLQDKGNAICSRGTDLYSVTLQDTSSPNPIYLMAKATLSQACVDTSIDGVERCKETIAKRTYFGHIDLFIKNTIEANFSQAIRRINAGLEQFHVCLNEEMVADLRYFNSLELDVDSLKSQLETQKTQFLNEIDRLSREYYYADNMNVILGVYTELDEVTNLQCDYLELLEKCECLENEISKSKMMSKSFEALQKHAINLEIDLQQCQEKIKMINLSKEFRKEREQYFEIQDLKAQLQDKGIVIRVILTTSVSRPQLKSNPMGDRVMRNNSQEKKQEVEDQCRNVKLSKNKMYVTACNDNLNAKTLNVNSMCATCDECVLNDKHDMCVLNSVAKPLKKTVASESNQKPRNNTRKLYERVSKTCSWWYPKFTPSGYKWKPKSGQENVNPNVSMPLG
nr:hypothetical protein [Tanacetum cinerariifolium]